MSYVEITNPRSFDSNGVPTEDGVNYLRLGITDKVLACNCKKDCPEHFGFIHLARPVYHVGFFNECLNILKCDCYNCSKVLVDDYDKYVEFKKIKNPKVRQLKIYNYCKSKTNLTCKSREQKKLILMKRTIMKWK